MYSNASIAYKQFRLYLGDKFVLLGPEMSLRMLYLSNSSFGVIDTQPGGK